MVAVSGEYTRPTFGMFIAVCRRSRAVKTKSHDDPTPLLIHGPGRREWSSSHPTLTVESCSLGARPTAHVAIAFTLGFHVRSSPTQLDDLLSLWS